MGLGAAGNAASAEDHAPPAPTRASALAADLISRCGGTLKSGSREVADCLETAALRRFSSAALPMAVNFVEASGQRLFGQQFSLRDDLQFTFGDGLRGNIDMVLPLAGNQSPSMSGFASGSAAPGRAVFIQQGASLWTDSDGIRRHDMRLGFVGRTPAWSGHMGIVGLSFFQQYNLERGHSRSVMGLDWTGPKIAAAFNYYLPTTGWLASEKIGYEERALEGMEFSGRFDLPHSFQLESSISRWKIPGSTSYSRAARAGIVWKYNRYISLNTQWNQSGIADGKRNGWSAGLQFSIPLGGREASSRRIRDIARYEGWREQSRGEFGLQDKLWRPADQQGQIAVVSRDIADARTGDGEAIAKFIGNQVSSGNQLQVKVSLTKPATQDRLYALRLIPGDGENPAVEGEDFSGAPVLVHIPHGKRHEIVRIQLLLNSGMKAPRSLGLRIAAL